MKYTLEDLMKLVEMEPNPNIDLDALYALAEDPNYEVRLLVAELLAFDKRTEREKSKEILLSMVRADEDPVVRAEAADSLAVYEDEELLPQLFELFSIEQDDMVRCYILFALFDIADDCEDQNIEEEIEEIFDSDEPLDIRLLCAGYLYRQGREELLDFLLDSMTDEDPYTRLTAIKQIIESIDEDNIEEIQAYFNCYNVEEEDFVSVRDKVYGILSFPTELLDGLDQETEEEEN